MVTAQYLNINHTEYTRSDFPGVVIPCDPANRVHVDTLAREMSIIDFEAPPTPPIRIVTARSFMRRLPATTQLAITEAARTSAEVDLWLRRALAGPIELDDPETAAGIEDLIAVGLLTEADKVALLADGTPAEAP